MKLACDHCLKPFEHPTFLGWCADCREKHRLDRERVGRCQHPTEGMYLDGTFTKMACPHSVFDPVRQANVCPLCGSADLEMGYGLGTGYGMGSYNYCTECNSFLDFSEDNS